MSGLDRNELMAALAEVAGRRFLGPVDGLNCVELVFDGDGGNLVSIFTDGLYEGQVAVGGVAFAESYARTHAP